MSTLNVKNDTAYLNTIKIFASFAVIILHVLGQINSYHIDSLNNNEIYAIRLLRNLTQWSVPAFLMISGVLFLNPQKEISIKRLLSKYVFRIVLAIFLFGLPFVFLELFYDSDYKFNFAQIKIAITYVLEGKTWDHMWYLYMIMGLYLITPLLRIFVRYCNRKILEYILIVLFIFTSMIPFINTVFSFHFNFYLPVTCVYLFYFLIGYYIHHYKKYFNKRNSLYILAAYLLFISVILCFSISLTKTGGLKCVGYSSPITVLLTIVIFSLFQQTNFVKNIFNKTAPLTFGVYLIHPLFINLIFKFIKFTPENYPFWIVVIMTIILTILFSFLFAYLWRKIPFVKKYVL